MPAQPVFSEWERGSGERARESEVGEIWERTWVIDVFS